jgi:hypothetical protein
MTPRADIPITGAGRPDASRLLADLKLPNRGWSAIVVGEWRADPYSAGTSRLGNPTVAIYCPTLLGTSIGWRDVSARGR